MSGSRSALSATPQRVGDLPHGAVDFVDAGVRRIVPRAGADARKMMEAGRPLDHTAERTADAIANVTLFGFSSFAEETFLDPR